MRTVLGILLVVVLLAVIGQLTGLINITGRGGSLPKVEASGGSLPDVDVDTAKVEVGTKNETVPVPTIKTEQKAVPVPDVDVKPANER